MGVWVVSLIASFQISIAAVGAKGTRWGFGLGLVGSAGGKLGEWEPGAKGTQWGFR